MSVMNPEYWPKPIVADPAANGTIEIEGWGGPNPAPYSIFVYVTDPVTGEPTKYKGLAGLLEDLEWRVQELENSGGGVQEPE